MKTETEYTQDFLTIVRKECPWVLPLKHSDRFTTGVPDMSLNSSRGHRTVWIEAKRIDRTSHKIQYPPHWIDKKEELQLYNVAALCGFYLIYDPIRTQVGFIRGLTAINHYRNKILIGRIDEPEFLHRGDFKLAFLKVVNYLKQEL